MNKFETLPNNDCIITIDPSLTSTAVVINDYKMVFTSKAKLKSGKLSKWFNFVEPHVNIYHHEFVYPKDYTTLERYKLETYSNIARTISNTCSNHVLHPIRLGTPINSHRKGKYNSVTFYIEGYSFSSVSGKLIDLVTFGSLLKHFMTENVTDDIRVIPPKTLKAEAAKLTYAPVDEGKRKPKIVYRNGAGLKGGSFKKHEMYKVLTDNVNLNCPWVNFLREHEDAVMESKAVPTPIDDINDAKILYEIFKKYKYH